MKIQSYFLKSKLFNGCAYGKIPGTQCCVIVKTCWLHSADKLLIWFYLSDFNWVLKIIQNNHAPALLCSVTGPENSHHPLNETGSKLDQLRLSQYRFFALQVVCLFLLRDLIGCLWCFPLFSVIDFDEFGFDFTTIDTLPPPCQTSL